MTLKRSSFLLIIKKICVTILYKGCEKMIDLEENKRKLITIKEKLKSIGDSL